MNPILNKIILVLTWPIKILLIGLIYGIRPFLGPSNCKYYVSCTQYGLQQLKDEPLHRAVWNTAKRVISCSNPWCEHGE